MLRSKFYTYAIFKIFVWSSFQNYAFLFSAYFLKYTLYMFYRLIQLVSKGMYLMLDK